MVFFLKCDKLRGDSAIDKHDEIRLAAYCRPIICRRMPYPAADSYGHPGDAFLGEVYFMASIGVHVVALYNELRNSTVISKIHIIKRSSAARTSKGLNEPVETQIDTYFDCTITYVGVIYRSGGMVAGGTSSDIIVLCYFQAVDVVLTDSYIRSDLSPGETTKVAISTTRGKSKSG